MVAAGDVELLRPDGPCHARIRLQCDGVHDVPVGALRSAHVLFQGAAERDVHHLQSAADRQQGEAGVQCRAGGFQVEGVLEIVDVVDAVVGVGGAVAVRGEVAAAGQQNTGETGEPGRHIGVRGVGRMEGEGFAARPPDGLDEGAGIDLGCEPQGRGGRRESGGNGYQGTHDMVHG